MMVAPYSFFEKKKTEQLPSAHNLSRAAGKLSLNFLQTLMFKDIDFGVRAKLNSLKGFKQSP